VKTEAIYKRHIIQVTRNKHGHFFQSIGKH